MVSSKSISANRKEIMGDRVFPQEIFELIIEKIRHPWTSTSHATLCTCSLVCKAFVPLCRQHLFSIIHLHRNRSEIKPPFRRLSEIFKNEPSISWHVRKFRYGFDEAEYDTTAYGQNDDPFNVFLGLLRLESLAIDSPPAGGERECPSYTKHEDIFPMRLMKSYLELGNLTDLDLYGIWDLPIVNILSLTKLTSLTVDGCLVDPAALRNNELSYNFGLKHFNARRFEHLWFVVLTRCCVELETICVQNSTYQSSNHNQTGFQTTTVPFSQTLHTFTYNNDVNLAPLCWAAESSGAKAFPGVTKFQIQSLGDLDTTQVGSCTINRLLQHLPRLEQLLVKGGEINIDAFASLDANQSVGTPPLKHITVKWRDYTDPDETPVVNSLADYLRHIWGHNSIETLELDMCVKPSSGWAKKSFNAWKKLDQTLLEDRQAHFPCLQRVTIAIRLKDKDEELTDKDVIQLEAPWKGALTRLFSTSELVFQLSVKPLYLSKSAKWLRNFKRQMGDWNLESR